MNNLAQTGIDKLRSIRNGLLAEADKKIVRWIANQSKVTEWESYRQALRDLPGQFPTGENVVWPTKPQE